MRKMILSMIGMAIMRWLTSPSKSKRSPSGQYANRRQDNRRRDRG